MIFGWLYTHRSTCHKYTSVREIRERTADEIKKVIMKRKFVHVNSLYVRSMFEYHEFPINSLHLLSFLILVMKGTIVNYFLIIETWTRLIRCHGITKQAVDILLLNIMRREQLLPASQTQFVFPNYKIINVCYSSIKRNGITRVWGFV